MIKTDKNLLDSYKYYKEKTLNPVDYKTYKYICFKFFDFIVNETIKGKAITLPERMGTVEIVGTKREKMFDEKGKCILPPDWVRTKALWERDAESKANKTIVRHTNEHTGGISYRFNWKKYDVPIRNKNFISFRLTRKNKRKISSAITKDEKEYKVIKTVK